MAFRHVNQNVNGIALDNKIENQVAFILKGKSTLKVELKKVHFPRKTFAEWIYCKKKKKIYAQN